MNGKQLNQRQLAWAGVIGPALFVAVFTIEGWLRPGYDPASMYVSELAFGPYGWIQNINFVLFGLLLLVFTHGTAAEYSAGKASRSGPVLLNIIAVCYIAFGLFVMDPVGTPQSEMSLHGIIHGLLGELVLLLMPACCFVYLRRFREETGWENFHWWTLVLGIVSALAGILLVAVFNMPDLQTALVDWVGWIQRIAIVSFLVWEFIFAVRLLRQD